jgi:hypothetical protein
MKYFHFFILLFICSAVEPYYRECYYKNEWNPKTGRIPFRGQGYSYFYELDDMICFVQLSRDDSNFLTKAIRRFDPNTALEELETFKNSLFWAVAEDLIIIKATLQPGLPVRIYDIIDIVPKYTS